MSVLLTPPPPKLPNTSTVDVNADSPRQPQLRSPGLSFFNRVFSHIDNLLVVPNRPHLSAHDLPPAASRSWSDSSTQTRVSEKGAGRSYMRDLSQNGTDYKSLPFRLSMNQAHDKLRRNMPYLRQGRCRIDLIAITGFWVTFVLATAGAERGSQHIGVFRALSVLRTVRLLTITSGTTVSLVRSRVG